jgi:hypothetical protein
MSEYRKLGRADVYLDERGRMQVDRDSVRRPSVSGALDGFGDDDFGDDEVGDDDVGDDEVGDDDIGDDEIGSRRSRARKAARHAAKLGRGKRWGRCLVTGTSTLTGAGATTVRIRLQHDFQGKDVTFTGSLAGTAITSIAFGDRPVFSDADGVDISVFANTSFLRGLLEGQKLGAGRDIIIGATLTGAGSLKAQVYGLKPVTHC